VVEEVDVPGTPTTSIHARAAGWAEAAVLDAALRDEATVAVASSEGASARASVAGDGAVHVVVDAGEPLDEIVLRSYCVGAAHMALGWVTSEAIAVDDEGEAHDLTIRSFGILRAKDTPRIDVEIVRSDRPPVNGSDAVFAAVAAAVWMHHGRPQDWPISPPKGRQPT
jgi:CO/xanthine dehydrogenase Mo-binding subunit